jgi:hypothetical protein
MNIHINLDVINAIDLSSVYKYVESCQANEQFFLLPAGKEHYKLLAYFAKIMEGPLIDIGTYYGFSAAVLSIDPEKKVITYDIYDWINDTEYTIKNRENIELRCMDCLYDIPTLLDANFICLDVSPHNALQEDEIFKALQKYKYKGLLFLDDIHLNNDMHDWWNSITLPKYDLTKYGHFTGSGIVVFDPSKYNIFLESE